MIYAKWAFFAPLVLIVNILAIILSPLIAAISVVFGTATLPAPLSWFYTHDDDLDGGQHQWPSLYPAGVKGIALLRQRIRWICRNPGYGFAANVAGIPVGTVAATGTLSSGLHHRFYVNGRCIGWAYRRDLAISKTRFIRIWFGWRCPSNDGKTHMLKCMFNPFRSR